MLVIFVFSWPQSWRFLLFFGQNVAVVEGESSVVDGACVVPRLMRVQLLDDDVSGAVGSLLFCMLFCFAPCAGHVSFCGIC